jgi:hypothetical protein
VVLKVALERAGGEEREAVKQAKRELAAAQKALAEQRARARPAAGSRLREQGKLEAQQAQAQIERFEEAVARGAEEIEQLTAKLQALPHVTRLPGETPTRAGLGDLPRRLRFAGLAAAAMFGFTALARGLPEFRRRLATAEDVVWSPGPVVCAAKGGRDRDQ